jgi:hypothetical protein
MRYNESEIKHSTPAGNQLDERCRNQTPRDAARWIAARAWAELVPGAASGC